MKRAAWLVGCLFGMSAVAAHAGSNSGDPHGNVIPLNTVGRQPKEITQLVHDTQKQWHFKPPVEAGRRVTSYVLITMNLETAKRDDGNYDTRLTYVSNMPVKPINGGWMCSDQQSRNAFCKMRFQPMSDPYLGASAQQALAQHAMLSSRGH
jgi:hypothetical protein